MDYSKFQNELVDKLIEKLVKTYVKDIFVKNRDELFAIFELINKKYKETGKCPICEHYRYNSKIISSDQGHFFIQDEDYSYLLIQINYCPICGKETH